MGWKETPESPTKIIWHVNHQCCDGKMSGITSIVVQSYCCKYHGLDAHVYCTYLYKCIHRYLYLYHHLICPNPTSLQPLQNFSNSPLAGLSCFSPLAFYLSWNHCPRSHRSVYDHLFLVNLMKAGTRVPQPDLRVAQKPRCKFVTSM